MEAEPNSREQLQRDQSLFGSERKQGGNSCDVGVIAKGREGKLSNDKFESSKSILVTHCVGRIHIDV